MTFSLPCNYFHLNMYFFFQNLHLLSEKNLIQMIILHSVEEYTILNKIKWPSTNTKSELIRLL